MVLKAGDLLDLGNFHCSKIFSWVMGQKKDEKNQPRSSHIVDCW